MPILRPAATQAAATLRSGRTVIPASTETLLSFPAPHENLAPSPSVPTQPQSQIPPPSPPSEAPESQPREPPAVAQEPHESIHQTSSLVEQIKFYLDHDPALRDVLPRLRASPDSSQGNQQGVSQDYRLDDSGLLLHKDKIYVPDVEHLRIQLLEQAHDSPSAGHQGQQRMFELLGRHFFGPGMRKFVNTYVLSCDSCQ